MTLKLTKHKGNSIHTHCEICGGAFEIGDKKVAHVVKTNRKGQRSNVQTDYHAECFWEQQKNPRDRITT